MGNRPLRMKIRRSCTPRVSRPPPNQTQSWRPCFPGPPRDRGWRRAHLLVPSPRGEMIGSSARAWLATTPCPGSFLPGSARGADEVVDGPFYGQKRLVCLLHPRYPRWQGGYGVRRHFPRWRVRCSALVPAERRHLEELSSSPVQSL